MRGLRAIALVAVSVLFGWTLATPAKAALIKKYTYTGNAFDEVSGVFTTDDRVTGYFLIDCGLAGGSGDCSDLPYAERRSSISIIDYSFSAGPFTLEPETSDLFDLEFSTDSNMLIDNWNISVGFVPNMTEFQEISTSKEQNSDFASFSNANDEIFNIGRIDFDPGTWTVETVSMPVPAPATPYLFPGALIVLLALSRRQRRSSL
jgi:hypothetical protein